jgi:CheY-like chemotaxis protein
MPPAFRTTLHRPLAGLAGSRRNLYQRMVVLMHRADHASQGAFFDQSNACRGVPRGVIPRAPVTPADVVSVVDDDESVRKATENLLRSKGWAVLTFESAQAYLASGAVGRTGCLISDVTMSGMSGIEMHTLLISRGHAPPTIFITGYPNAQDESVVLSNGALAYLEKPVESKIILEWVQKLIGGP